MRILVEAFACRPGAGSEEGVGWAYPVEYARLGHEVVVVTSSIGREAIEEELRRRPVAGLRFIYVPRRRWPSRLGWTVGSAVQYVLWLWEASESARRLDRETPFEVLQHTSYGSLLGGSFLWRLGRPLVFGPTGGGQTTPPAFRPLFGTWWRSEALRSLVVRHLWRLAWHARRTTRDASVVLASNDETLLLARRMGARRARLLPDAALPAEAAPEAPPERPARDGLRLLWLGRIMPRKAAELAVLAVEGLPEDLAVTLEVVGRGANEEMDAAFRHWVATRPTGGRVVLTGPVPFSDVWAHYRDADVLLFTSVRDSTGVQVLEAMGQGLPVICLDHQGARIMVPDAGGIKVPPTDLPGTVAGLRRAIVELAGDPDRRARMGRVNHARAVESTWPRLARDVLAVMEEVAPGRDAAQAGDAPVRDVERYVGTNAGYPDDGDDYDRERYRQFARHLPPGAHRVLDAGCGGGRAGEALLGVLPGLELVGVDVLAERLRHAERRGYAETARASITALPFADGSFDAVLAGEVIEHLEEADVDVALGEIRRVLHPGGALLLTTPNPRALKVLLRDGTTLGHSHLSAHTAGSLRRRLERQGFRAVAVVGSGRASRLVGETVPLPALYGSLLIKAVRG